MLHALCPMRDETLAEIHTSNTKLGDEIGRTVRSI